MRPTAKASSSACPFPHKCLLDLFKLTNRVFVFDTRCSHTPPNSLEECLVHIKLKFSLAETRPASVASTGGAKASGGSIPVSPRGGASYWIFPVCPVAFVLCSFNV
jgi:hypothetical protein